MNKLTIATRGSKLALWQSEHIQLKLQEQYPDMQVEICSFKTKGDKILDTPLAKIGGKGLFTKELEVAILEQRAHLAVHSLKDVPVDFDEGLVLACVTKREDRRDAMLSEKYSHFEELPKGAVVGTTSLRRRMQLLHVRDDLVIKDLRGNINTRIAKLKNGEYDAIILANAGINRLELHEEVAHVVPLEFMVPAMGQAVLGIECMDDVKTKELLAFLEDKNAFIETTIERDFVRALEGGCQVPIGISAFLEGETVRVKAIVGMPDASIIIKEELSANKEEFKQLGQKLADIFIAKGAKEILQKAQDMAMNEIF